MALESNLDQQLKEKSKTKITLKINHLESCYNYKTIGNNYNIVSSVLSNYTFEIPLESKKGKTNSEYLQIAQEKTVQPHITSYKNLFTKCIRIQGTFYLKKTLNYNFDKKSFSKEL